MKRIIFKNRVLVVAFFTVFSTSSLSLSANEGNRVLPVELKYAGQLNNQPLYKLVVAGNKDQDVFTIVIRDENNNVLFKESIQGENFTKSFLLNTEELGEDTLRFEITSKNTKKSVSYEINRHADLEEEMAVIEAK